MKKALAMMTAVLAAATVLVGVSLAQPSADDTASALSGSSFDAGNIISDAAFYNGSAMSTDAIQAFLVAQGGTCRSTSCLSNGQFSMNARGADAMCGAVAGGSSLSTAQIITQVSSACGISPKVILVTLQKEQSLVTATNPSAATLARAMGYACPDTANGGCDPAYSGVGNQVYWSAWQWKRYGNPAGTSNYFTWFAPGTRSVQYSPTVSCGTKTVQIRNQATAALYYYTPYTPNQAALDNLYGTGDGCSAYGNRNFWRLYNDWFGDPTGTASPIGSVDGISGGFDSVSVHGWAMDAVLNDSVYVDVYVDGVGRRFTANGSRPDVAAAYPGRGSAHGFDLSVPSPTGTHTVCVYAIGVDPSRNTQLSCASVYVTTGSPVGAVETIRAAPGGIALAGWALDPESSSSIAVHAYVDGAFQGVLTANGDRPDVGSVWGGTGNAHGFAQTIGAGPGTHTVCLYGINVGSAGTNSLIAPCSTVSVPTSGGFGAVDVMAGALTSQGATLTVSGWAIDGGRAAPTFADVYVDGRGSRVVADRQRTDVGRIWPGYGDAHGFTTTIPVSFGTHSVCVYAISASGANNTLRCGTVTVQNTTPIGSFDSASGVAGGIAVSGWVIDPDTPAPTFADVYVDGRGTRLTADQARADVGAAYPASGSAHGFSGTVPAAPGTRSVCIYAIDSSGGANPTLACRTVTVP